MPKKLIVKQYESETKAVENERSLTVTISTNAVDRSGDVVEPNGGKFVNFKKNPVVLMAHDYSGLPIGRASDLVKTDNGITAKVTFPEEGTYPLADTVYNMYKQKFMRAWSIGFIPTKSEEITDDKGQKNTTGYRFLNWELLEFSACSVPANPEALTNMVSKGIDVGLLEEEGLIEIVEGKDVEKVEEPEVILASQSVIDDNKKDVSILTTTSGSDDKLEKMIEQLKFYPEIKFIVTDDKEADNADGKDKDFESMAERFCEKYLAYRHLFEDSEKQIKELEIKAGAVLNAKNKKYLADSLLNIQAVLDSAGTTEESIKDVDEIDYDKGDDNVIEIIHDTVDDILITETKAEPTVIELSTFEVDDEEIKNLVNEKLNYALGRVSK